MFRIRRNILDSLKFQRKRLARSFASTPTLPEFADVVIIGKRVEMSRENSGRQAEGKKENSLKETFIKSGIQHNNQQLETSSQLSAFKHQFQS